MKSLSIIRFFIGAGIVGIVLFCLALPFGAVMLIKSLQSSGAVSSALGVQGAVCGGEFRLPCGEGLICDIQANSKDGTGSCVSAPSVVSPTVSTSTIPGPVAATGTKR